MFICNDCLTASFKQEPATHKSVGRCEWCGEVQPCNDIPSKYLTPKMEELKPPTPRAPTDTIVNAQIIVMAVRYALGRFTYAPKVAADAVKRAWPDLTHSTKQTIKRDVNEFVKEQIPKEQPFGGIDLQTWMLLDSWMANNE